MSVVNDTDGDGDGDGDSECDWRRNKSDAVVVAIGTN